MPSMGQRSAPPLVRSEYWYNDDMPTATIASLASADRLLGSWREPAVRAQEARLGFGLRWFHHHAGE